MVTKAALDAAKAAYDIEAACITEMKDYFDDEQFAKAVELLATAPRIGAAGSGHSGIICQHFAHLLCCIEQPARFISPAEAVHGAQRRGGAVSCAVGDVSVRYRDDGARQLWRELYDAARIYLKICRGVAG